MEISEFKSQLKSSMKDLIAEFIERKRLAGNYLSDDSIRFFVDFDSFMFKFFPSETCINKNVSYKFIEEISKRVSNNTVIRILTPIRQFAKYLIAIGNDSIIPEIPCKYIRYNCHLITTDELVAFFKSADTLPASSHHDSLREITAPVCFRLLYSSGLRTGEVRRLSVNDVNLESGKIFIRESKAHQLRIVIVSDDMLKVLRNYDHKVNQIAPNRTSFFVKNINGQSLKAHSINMWFHDIWDNLPEAKVQKMPKMTSRDFRHCFAFNCIAKWYKEGRDINSIADYLVTYMGHSDFAQSSYYIHLAEIAIPELRNSIHRIDDGILPDIDSMIDDDEVPYDA